MAKDDTAVDTTTKNGEVSTPNAVEKFHTYMLSRAAMESTGRAAEVMEQQGLKILSANPDDVNAIWDADAGGTIQARDVVGLEVQINSFTVIRSTRTFDDSEYKGHGYYVSYDAVCLGGPQELLTKTGLKIGENFVLQTGADLINFKVRAFEAGGYLPIEGVISGTRTQSDNTVLRLTRRPVRAGASAS